MEHNTFINNNLDLIKAFDRLTFQTFFIINENNGNIVYISPKFYDTFPELCHTQEIGNTDIWEFTRNFINEDFIAISKEVYSKWKMFINNINEQDKPNYIFENVIKRTFSKKILYYNVMQTIIKSSGNSDTCYILCNMSLPSLIGFESPKIWNTKTHETYSYNFEKHKWEQKAPIELSDTEKYILILSARGFTVPDIAETINKSTEAVKSSKQRIFHKFGTRNIQQAIIFAINHNMI